jgi:transposase-like protein
MIEQDHRGVKSCIAPMLGCNAFKWAAVTFAGIELLRRIRKSNLPSIVWAFRVKLTLPFGQPY